MTEQEALEILDNECQDPYKVQIALKVARLALKKQIAKKMSIGNDNGRPRKRCGNCGCFVLPESNYCSKCGQKSDWSEV